MPKPTQTDETHRPADEAGPAGHYELQLRFAANYGAGFLDANTSLAPWQETSADGSDEDNPADGRARQAIGYSAATDSLMLAKELAGRDGHRIEITDLTPGTASGGTWLAQTGRTLQIDHSDTNHPTAAYAGGQLTADKLEELGYTMRGLERLPKHVLRKYGLDKAAAGLDGDRQAKAVHADMFAYTHGPGRRFGLAGTGTSQEAERPHGHEPRRVRRQQLLAAAALATTVAKAAPAASAAGNSAEAELQLLLGHDAAPQDGPIMHLGAIAATALIEPYGNPVETVGQPGGLGGAATEQTDTDGQLDADRPAWLGILNQVIAADAEAAEGGPPNQSPARRAAGFAGRIIFRQADSSLGRVEALAESQVELPDPAELPADGLMTIAH